MWTAIRGGRADVLVIPGPQNEFLGQERSWSIDVL